MSRNLGQRDAPIRRIASNQQGIRNEERKPVLGGPLIYVGDYVGPDDPSNDPLDASPDSPPWLNDFYYVTDFPIWFAHGVDGETDMGGAYDLVSGAPANGTIAFMMPREWAEQAQAYTAFVVLLDDSGAVEDWVYGMAAQIIDVNDSAATVSDIPVRIYWPIWAQGI